MGRRKLLGCFGLCALVASGWATRSHLQTADNAADTEADAIRLSSPVGDRPEVSGLRVSIIRVDTQNRPVQWTPYRGVVRPRMDSPLSLRRGGLLAMVGVREGDSVRAGQVLAELDLSDLKAREQELIAAVDAADAEHQRAIAGPRKQTIRAAEANLQQLQSLAEAARLRAQRQEDLLRRGAGDQQSLDNTRLTATAATAAAARAAESLAELREGTRAEDLRAASARLLAAKAALESNQVDQKDSRIVAPFDGTVRSRLLDPGAFVAPGAPVLNLQAAPPLEARFGLPPRIGGRIEVGQRVAVSLDDTSRSQSQTASSPQALSDTVAAEVVRIHPAIDPKTRTRAVDVRFSPEINPPPGTLASLYWQSEDSRQDDSFWVPTTALVRSGRGLWSVYVVQPDADSDITSRSHPTSNASPAHVSVSPGAARQGAGMVSNRRVAGTVARRNVRVLQTVGDQCLIRGAIEKGDAVIDTGVHRVAPGADVWGEIPESTRKSDQTARNDRETQIDEPEATL